METDNLLLAVAIIAVAVSVVGAGVTYNSFVAIDNFMTGFATSSGDINVTIGNYTSINFTTSNINFGSGAVSGDTAATLFTNGTATIGGTWTSPSSGFIIENIGNVNLSIRIVGVDSAATLIGGTGSSYQYLVTNEEADSCVDITPTAYADVNISGDGTLICSNFISASGSDEIGIDIKLVIPIDATQTGAVSDTLTATIAAV